MDEFEIIPSEQWPSLFDTFNAEHAGWLVRLWSVDTANLEAGIADEGQAALQDLKLNGLALEDRSAGSDLVLTAHRGDSLTHHVIRQIQSVSTENDVDGQVSGLRIDDGDGETWLLRFRPDRSD